MWKRKSRPKPIPFTPTEEQIRAKAYELWQQRGDESSAEDNWNDAIRLLKREQAIKQIFRPILPLWRCTGFGEKKVWDFMQLLLVPALLAIGGFWLNQEASQRQDSLNQQRHDQDQQLADDKAKQETLNKYLDQMSELMINKGLRKALLKSEVFVLAQARTTTALRDLDIQRRSLLIVFLRSADLLNPKAKPGILQQTDLSYANFQQTDFSYANFQQTDLSYANFQHAYLKRANFQHAYLWGANLQHAVLSYANFQQTDLSYANFQQAYLNSANLQHAVLLATDLRQTVNFTQQQLEGKEQPLLCNVAIEKGFTVNPNRDCDRMPQILQDRYSEAFKTIEAAQAYVNEARKKKWD